MGMINDYLEDKIYLIRHFEFKFLNLREITLVVRKKKGYDHPGIGIWWKKRKGVGIVGKPFKVLKYLMIGFDFVNLKLWFDFKWIGKDPKEKQPIQFREGKEKITIESK
jgi:hypothetical protein